jgi:hypothetical protein
MELEFVDAIDVSVAEKDDRSHIRSILLGVLQFHDPMPKVEVNVVPTPDHYNISIKGWTQAIPMKKWVDMFDGSDRDGKYDMIIESIIYPVEGKVVIRVKRSKFQDRKKRK